MGKIAAAIGARYPASTSGVTPSERYLAQLARRSFLSLWSHTNLFTDESRKNGKGDGKELCDLMVVFDNHVLLFSDKQCDFPQHKDINIAWARWYRRAVRKSVNQLRGAESWIRRFPERVFLDRQCTRQFPVPIPDLKNAQFHRLAVTRGAYAKCREFFGGQSTGSLVINNAVSGSDHLETPFTVGLVTPNQGYVHVLDELTLEVVLRELDTISDLVAYLEKKEALLTKPGRIVTATGEEQLVAMYLTHLNKSNEHDFVEIPDDIDSVFIDEGYWEDFIRNPQYNAKKDADRVSYAWDGLIEHFITYGRDDAGDEPSNAARNVEPILRVLASEPRIRRRGLAEQLLEAMGKRVQPGQRFARLGISNDFPDTAYLFLILPQPDFIKSHEEYREGRRAILQAYCRVAKLRAPAARRIVGIATEPAGSEGASEDLVLLETDGANWTSEHEEDAKELQEIGSILVDGSTTCQETHVKEYPDIGIPPRAPVLQEFRPLDQTLNRAQRRAMERGQRREAKRQRSR